MNEVRCTMGKVKAEMSMHGMLESLGRSTVLRREDSDDDEMGPEIET